MLENRKSILQEKEASKYIPYSHHVTESIIATENHDYMSVWKLEGRSHQCASKEEQKRWVEDLNTMIKGFASDKLAFWTHVVRRKAKLPISYAYENFFNREFDQKYRLKFDQDKLLVNEIYVTIILRQSTDSALSFFSKYEKLSEKEVFYRQEKSIKTLNEINTQFGSATRKYRPELLTTYSKSGFAYSKPLEFLSFLVNGELVRMPVCRERFKNYMSVNRVLFSRWGELGEVRQPEKQRFFGMLELRDYEPHTQAGQLDELLNSNMEFILTNSFTLLSKHSALELMKRQRKLLEDTESEAYEEKEDISIAMNDLSSKKFAFGEHHATLLIWSDDIRDLRDNLSIARSRMNESGIVAGVLDMALEAGFWSQLPAVWKYRPRPVPISSKNFFCFSSFHNYLSGKRDKNPWGEAVTTFKSESGAPIYFNYHSSKLTEDARGKRYLGNGLILGKSGTGKTSLAGMLVSQSEKFGVSVVVYDKDRGMEILIKALGGKYYAFKHGVSSGLNPFQLEPTEKNLSFLKDFVALLISMDGEPVTARDKADIDKAVESVMNYFDQEKRNLSILDQQLFETDIHSDQERMTVSDRLKVWLRGGRYGWLFDNDSDSLNLTTHKIYGFDTTEFLKDAAIREPLLEYLTFRTNELMDGRPFIQLFEELWHILGDKFFEKLIEDNSLTIRKKNGLLLFSTQEPNHVLESKNAKTIVQQTAFRILLPNPAANRDDYINKLQLSPAEFDVLTALPETSRKFLIQQGGMLDESSSISETTVVAELDLSGMDDELLILSGTTDRAELVSNIIEEIGTDDVERWWPIYKQRVSLQG